MVRPPKFPRRRTLPLSQRIAAGASIGIGLGASLGVPFWLGHLHYGLGIGALWAAFLSLLAPGVIEAAIDLWEAQRSAAIPLMLMTETAVPFARLLPLVLLFYAVGRWSF